MQRQTQKRYLAYLLVVAIYAVSAAAVNSQERKIAPSETNGCNCADASLIGDTVGTQFSGGPVVNRAVNSSVELPNSGPTLGAAGSAPNPCCPPINPSILQTVLAYQGLGSISGPYTLKFQPTSSFDSQMQGYVNYLSTFGFNSLIVDWTLKDIPTLTVQGTGHTTWNSGGSGNPVVVPPGFFTGFPMQVNIKYKIFTSTHLLNPGQVFFPAKCAENDIQVQVQVLPAARGSKAVLQFSDGKTIIKSIPLSEKTQR